MFPIVLAEVRNEFLNFENTGMSITEISHRSSEYSKINNEAQNAVKQLLSVPDNYKILFLPGGGQGMFSAIAMNLMNRTGSADYVVAGIWSGLAAKEAAKYGTVNPVFPKPGKLGDIPDSKSWTLNPNASYLYYCDNETIEGIEFPFIPETRGSVPIVVDMASNIMTRKFDVSKFGLIFAPVQKNLGTAGVVLAIIRDDLLGTPMKICPSVLNFTELANTNSILNTPPIFQVYVTGKILQWINIQGGLKEMEKQCCQKSQLLYNAINQSNNFYECHVPENFRSRINVSFKIGGGNDNLEEKFVQEAEEHRIYQLRGHRLVGGIRVSLYNAVSYEDTETLVQFMKNFQAKYQNSIERHL
ncbi:probable phosphoserine aminotransferase isoform X2 [Cylas formicarius]|uniref:probable phosphoserine aminotransferase isoform X2 n=1 Tax=Cylas formicarius TaxID=197179 RepID=UPI0029584F24|nr:probable phosphoserine aminotransferase isoform X2 [Cylas formicarius]